MYTLLPYLQRIDLWYGIVNESVLFPSPVMVYNIKDDKKRYFVSSRKA